MGTIGTDPLASFRFTKSDLHDLAGVEALLTREREWYGGVESFQANHDIARAVADRRLRLASNTDTFRLIRRFADRPDTWRPFLNAAALRLRDEHGVLFQKILADAGVDSTSIRLAEVSMTRTQTYQDTLVALPGQLAVADSTHTRGGARDVDVAGYYELRDGLVVSVSTPDREPAQQRFLAMLREENGPGFELPVYEYTNETVVFDAAIEAARILQERGDINLVPEYAGTPNACLHIAADPNY